MSSFPAQFVDMTVDRGLFDHTGAQPPATKITIELPPEYIEKPEPDATPPYSEFRVDAKVLADIQTAVMREYGGVARRCLNAFRQDVGLGDLAINGRRTNLGAGVGMSYTSQFGNESIRIHVSKEGVRRLIGGEDDLYMLIIFTKGEGFNFASIPMSELTKDTYKVEKTGPLTLVGDVFWYGGTQLKIASDTHVIASSMRFNEDGTISNILDGTYYCNSADSIFKGVTTSDVYSVGNVRLLNWTKKTVYAATGHAIDFSKSPPVATLKSEWLEAPYNVAAVGPNGELWSYANLDLEFGTDHSFNGTQGMRLNFSQPFGGSISSYGPGLADYYKPFRDQTGSPQTYNITERWMTYSNKNGVDIVSVSSATATMAETSYFPNLAGSISFLGLFGSSIDTGPVGYTGQINICVGGAAPGSGRWFASYMYGTETKDMFVQWNNADNSSNWVLQTPFEKIDGAARLQNMTFAANGKDSLSHFWYTEGLFGQEHIRIYFNKTSIYDRLKNALGLNSGWDIYNIFLDIKKSDIDKLK